MSLQCESGCVSRGKHVSGCEDSSCLGCLPRAAEVGVLCHWCWQQLSRSVLDIPVVARHLTFLAEPSLSSPLGKDSAGGGVAGSVSLYAEELDYVDQMAAMFGAWALYIDDFVKGANPQMWGQWTFVESADRGGSAAPSADDVPIRSTVEGLESVTRWMMQHLRWVAGQCWAPEMMREVSLWVNRAWGRWPHSERAHAVPMPCPVCDQWSLEYRPPVVSNSPAIVSCSFPDCGRQWVDDEWTALVRVTLEGQGVRV